MSNIENIKPPLENVDSVKMMRDIREMLSEKYWQHPGILKKEMEEIRKKYHFKIMVTGTVK